MVPLRMDFALVPLGRISKVPASLVFSPNKLALPVRCLSHPVSRIHSIVVGQVSSSAASCLSFLISLSRPMLKAKESLFSVFHSFDLQFFAMCPFFLQYSHVRVSLLEAMAFT
jgi:hypothetical protein